MSSNKLYLAPSYMPREILLCPLEGQNCTFCWIPTVEDMLIDICKKLFAKMQDSSDKLNRILPPLKVNAENPRNSKKYPFLKTITGHYKNTFVSYALYNPQ